MSLQVATGSVEGEVDRRRVAFRIAGIVMRNRIVMAVMAAGMITFGLSSPASAATSGVSAATVTVTGGFLSITVPTSGGNLGTQADTVGGETISGLLGQVQVNDARDDVAGSGWVSSVIASAFTPPSGPAIPASAISYTVGAITQVGTATYTADNPVNLTGVVPAVTATGITGDNSATWDPMINVVVPGGFAANVYSATITQSVL
jgi:hypothetical protein